MINLWPLSSKCLGTMWRHNFVLLFLTDLKLPPSLLSLTSLPSTPIQPTIQQRPRPYRSLFLKQDGRLSFLLSMTFIPYSFILFHGDYVEMFYLVSSTKLSDVLAQLIRLASLVTNQDRADNESLVKKRIMKLIVTAKGDNSVTTLVLSIILEILSIKRRE